MSESVLPMFSSRRFLKELKFMLTRYWENGNVSVMNTYSTCQKGQSLPLLIKNACLFVQ